MTGPGDLGVLMLGPDEFGARRMARHQFARLLARRHPVVWVDPPPTPRSLAAGRGRLRGVVEAIDGVTVWRPGATHARLGRLDAAAGAQARRLRRAVRLLRDRGARRVVLYLWRPDEEALDAWDGPTVYHISDEYTFADVEAPVSPVETRVIERVDRVFVHSPTMLDKKGGINAATELIPNGVDYDAFARDHAEPADLAAVRRPRIGYVGVLKRQLDWNLIGALVRDRPDWQFCLVGPVSHRERIGAVLDEIERAPNAALLGEKPATALPAYTANLDVGLMPYRVTPYTRYIYPLKLHEYLAAGCPVVSAPIPAVTEFADLVEIVPEGGSWPDAIARALDPASRAPERLAARRATARAHDWEGLVARVAERLAGLPGHGEVR